MFCARPGIYWPPEPTELDLEKIRARGIGRGVLYAQQDRAIAAFERGAASVKLAEVTRFIGAKNTISFSPDRSPKYKRSKRYGQWEEKEIELSFAPMPKRGGTRADGRLTLRSFPGQESQAYDPGSLSMDALMLRALEQELAEQPDGEEFTDYSE
jgi:hypothetical protein